MGVFIAGSLGVYPDSRLFYGVGDDMARRKCTKKACIACGTKYDYQELKEGLCAFCRKTGAKPLISAEDGLKLIAGILNRRKK